MEWGILQPARRLLHDQSMVLRERLITLRLFAEFLDSKMNRLQYRRHTEFALGLSDSVAQRRKVRHLAVVYENFNRYASLFGEEIALAIDRLAWSVDRVGQVRENSSAVSWKSQ